MARGAIRSARRWRFDVAADRFWDRIAATDEYATWWPWLREFEAGDGLVAGERWRCRVAPPLPYSVRFDLTIVRIDGGRSIDATVSGDIEGDARLTVAERSAGCSVALASELRPVDPLLRTFARVARPMVVFGHDWILDEGLRQFVRAIPPD